MMRMIQIQILMISFISSFLPQHWHARCVRIPPDKDHLDVLKWARAQDPPCPEYHSDNE